VTTFEDWKEMASIAQQPAPSNRNPGTCSRSQCLLVSLLLLTLVGWTFLPCLHNDFVNYDDPDYVTANAHVQGGLTWSGVQWAFSSRAAANWHPVTWLSHMADWQVYGGRAWGHHLTSVLLHGINAVLLFVVLRNLTGSLWRSLAVAVLFGVHPLRVESVAWVAERKDVLSGLFWLLTLWAYARYAQSRDQHSTLNTQHSTFNVRAGKWYGLALVLFALGLMSKPMVVTLPFVLLLLDYWPLGRMRGAEAGVRAGGRTVVRLALEKWPFFLLSAVSCAVTFLVQRHGGAMVLMAGQPFEARLENALVSYCRYLGKFFWPENLSVVYPVVDHWAGSAVILSLALLLGVSVFAVAVRRRFPYGLTGWYWYVGTLVPVIGLVAVGEQAMADRYTYVPMIGMLILLVWGAGDLIGHRRPQAGIAAGVAVVAALACIALTRRNIGCWRDGENLFRHAIAVTENNYSAHASLADALLAQRRFEEALAEAAEAVRLRPDSAESRNNLGANLARVGRLDEAIAQFQEATRLQPGYVQAHANLARALDDAGRLDDAIEEYRQVIRRQPDLVTPYNQLGIALAKRGRLDEAIAQFQTAIRLNPKDSSSHNNLGIALSQQGRAEEAIAQFREAVRLNPANESAQQNLRALQ
jgi:protein O-mannosyl-transferase